MVSGRSKPRTRIRVRDAAALARGVGLRLGAGRRRILGRTKASWLRVAKGSTGRRGGRAYNLVVLAVAVTLLNVWIASTLPLWSHQIQRDKEAELIFRGLQYAEAIRLYQANNDGRLPTSLKELIEVEPRSLRQLWDNPMREDGRWGLVPQGLGGQVGRDATQPVAGNPGDTGLRQLGDGGEGAGQGLSRDPFGDEKSEEAGVILSRDPDDDFGAPPSTIPIRGVFHPGSEEATRIFLGAENTREWLFTAQLFATVKPLEGLNVPVQIPFATREIGKPCPPGVVPFVTQPSNQAPQQGQNVGGDASGRRNTGGVGLPQSPGTNSQGQPIIGTPSSGASPAGGGDGTKN